MSHNHDNLQPLPIFMVQDSSQNGSQEDPCCCGEHHHHQGISGACCSLPNDKLADRKAEIKFPCDFPIKAIGLKADDLKEHTHKLISKHAPDLDIDSMYMRPSSKGKYLSISATINATSREQLDAIYAELTKDPRILYTL